MGIIVELEKKDKARRAIIQVAIKAALDVIDCSSENPLEKRYITYKVGGHLVANVLEFFDQEIMSSDMTKIVTGKE